MIPCLGDGSSELKPFTEGARPLPFQGEAGEGDTMPHYPPPTPPPILGVWGRGLNPLPPEGSAARGRPIWRGGKEG